MSEQAQIYSSNDKAYFPEKARADHSMFSRDIHKEVWINEINISSDSKVQLDINEIKKEAEEEGFVEPSQRALENAQNVLGVICCVSSRNYEVYPMPDGRVSIDVPNGKGSSIWILCEESGRISCLVNIKGNPQGREDYGGIEKFTIDFVSEALAELDQQI